MNPYETQVMSQESFLETTYKLIIKKMDVIIDIQKQAKRDKLPLPLLKSKYGETSKILKVITELVKTIDYDSEHGPELADILNDAGIILSQANISITSEESLIKYDIVKGIFESFLL